MRTYSDKKLSHLLSLYLDNQLREKDRYELEAYLKTNEDARQKLEMMRRVRSALRDKKPLPLNDRFYFDLQKRIEEQESAESLVPSKQRRFFPAFVGVATLALAIVTFAAVSNTDWFKGLWNISPEQVQQVYEESQVNGWVMPLFKRTSKDMTLHYAMFGSLPLNDQENTLLKVNNDADDGYQFELVQGNQPFYEDVSLDKLYAEINPSAMQRNSLDSILLLASNRLEEGVLLDDHNKVAIAPAVAKLHTVVLGAFAAALRPEQRKRMDQYMQSVNSPFALRTVVNSDLDRTAKPQLVTALGYDQDEKFVVLSPDTVFLAAIRINKTHLRERMEQLAAIEERLSDKAEALSERIAKTRSVRFERKLAANVEAPAPPDVPVCNVEVDSKRMKVIVRTEALRDYHNVARNYIAPRQGLQQTVSTTTTTRIRGNQNRPRASVREEHEVQIVLERDKNGTFELQIDLDSVLSSANYAIQFLENELQRLEYEEREVQKRWNRIELTFDSLAKSFESEGKDSLLQNGPTYNMTPEYPPPAPEYPPDQLERDRLRKLKQYKQRLNEYLRKVKQNAAENK